MTENYATQIVASVGASAVETVVVIDDAYDPPTVAEEHQGELLGVLQRADLRKFVSEESLGDEDLQSAIEALKDGEPDHEAVDGAISSLFDVYLQRRTAEVDPDGQFARLKGSALESLDPLLELFERCGDRLCIRRVGKEAAFSVCREVRPDVILVDFFLSPPDITAASSIDLLKRILEIDGGAPPAVILMSSKDVETEAQEYRSSLEGRVTALRFGFLNKNWIHGAGAALMAESDAADVLMETSGIFEFGRTLETALLQWKSGAEAGLDELYEELRDLDVKDFAYLLRFRLYEEGEPFADYLEWFLGESLRAVIGNEVKWNAEAFGRLNEKELTEGIEGAQPVPPSGIAEFFHRIRFDPRENRARHRFGLGDLFVGPDDTSVRLVITRDSDIIVRKERRRAPRLLTVGGSIIGLDDERAIAGNLIVYGTPKAITWNLKDVMSHDFADTTSELEVSGTVYSYFATMRPLATHAIKQAAMGDLEMIGSAVPPTVDVVAGVRVYWRRKVGGRVKMIELDDLEDAYAQVFMPRGGSDRKLRALFSPRFVRTLAVRLAAIDAADLSPDDRSQREEWIENAPKVRKAMLRVGVGLPGDGIFKDVALLGARKGKKRNWLEIEVDVSDGARIHLQATDPLAL